MRPEKFDELIKRKFDQNDFEYSPQNWELLSGRLDEHPKSNRNILLWATPLIGVAASVTLAFGITSYMHHSASNNNSVSPVVIRSTLVPSNNLENNNFGIGHTVIVATLVEGESGSESAKTNFARVNKNTEKRNGGAISIVSAIECDNIDLFKINLKDFIANNKGVEKGETVLLKEQAIATLEIVKQKTNKTKLTEKTIDKVVNESLSVVKPSKSSIILLGGVNYGNTTSGYTFGAAARTMINSRVYVEGEIAFAGSNNTQSAKYMDYSNSFTGKMSSSARATSDESAGAIINGTGNQGVIKSAQQSYNLNYIQVSPSLCYRLAKRFSVGLGTDFQQALSDNRPAPSTVDRGNIQVAPLFDIGVVGKTEFTLTSNIKAAIFYREGINNIITMNKFIDRNYIQFQVKYAVFNR